VCVACKRCPSLTSKRVSPHVLRHSAAMELLQAGVDCSVIALWLGHESIETTQTYLQAHLALKEAALAKLKPYQRGRPTRFRANDRLLAFPGCAVDGQTMPNGAGAKSARRLANGPERRVTSRTIRHSSRVGINRQAQRHRSPGLARRRAGPPAGSPRQAHPRTPALELASSKRRSRCLSPIGHLLKTT